MGLAYTSKLFSVKENNREKTNGGNVMSETKVSKKQEARRRNMRNTAIMAVLCVVLLSSATYAWFTLSESAKITNLSLSVDEASGVLIADVEEDGSAGVFGSVLELAMPAKTTLRPATLGTFGDITTFSMLKDVRDDNDYVVGYEALAEGEYTIADTPGDAEHQYCYEKTFFMQVQGEDKGIVLSKAVATDTELTGGTYIGKKVGEDESAVAEKLEATDLHGATALRIAFFNEAGDVLAIYEPNSDSTADTTDSISAQKDANSTAALALYENDPATNKIQQSVDGTFTGSADQSGVLFNLKADNECKITMRVYIDGEDTQCVNDIALDDILGNLQFKTDDPSEDTNVKTVEATVAEAP